ncbi:porin [Shinella sp. H4-D48]|uniref:porin n=1 Tax=Shinella sp. H4-D48 TaxID=2925841 RepID=UPI001F53297E|nr:porin [Shinella sp. H4-D48]UNK37120.1 porin [Shinella sp. H4-D48]
MNIKSLLIGSAAALVAVSGAQAADAIVAAEPEPMEYVRVCDAFGTGFFYIPGTETCLKIGGFVRFQTSFGRDIGGTANEIDTNLAGSHSDWDSFTKVQVQFDARNDTELGTLRSYIAIEANADSDQNGGDGDFDIDEAFIELAGFKVGFFYSWWDSGINGETDTNGNTTEFNSIAYTYDGGTWRAGLSLDEIEGAEYVKNNHNPLVVGNNFNHNNLGVAGTVGFSLGGVNLDILGGYDNAVGEGAIRTILSADLGPGTLQVLGVWASDPNTYWDASEWSIAASYAFKATEKLTITPGVQYFDNLALSGKVKGLPSYGFNKNEDQWRVGVTVGYEIVSGLNFLGTVNYNNRDSNVASRDTDWTSGFLRLQRNF